MLMDIVEQLNFCCITVLPAKLHMAPLTQQLDLFYNYKLQHLQFCAAIAGYLQLHIFYLFAVVHY